MIKLEHLSAGYGGKAVLEPASIVIPDHCVTAVIGPNGSGKSTILKTMAGILQPCEGQVFLNGNQLSSLPDAKRAQLISYLPQSRNVPEITAFRMVLHARFPYLGWPRRYRDCDRKIARIAMQENDAWELRDSRMSKLSGGERQKVYLSMVFAQNAPNILLDEPTTYLDIAHQFSLMQAARDLAAEGRCVVMILHDLTMAMQYADELILADHHELSPLMTPEEMFLSHRIDDAFKISLQRVQTQNGWRYFINA